MNRRDGDPTDTVRTRPGSGQPGIALRRRHSPRRIEHIMHPKETDFQGKPPEGGFRKEGLFGLGGLPPQGLCGHAGPACWAGTGPGSARVGLTPDSQSHLRAAHQGNRPLACRAAGAADPARARDRLGPQTRGPEVACLRGARSHRLPVRPGACCVVWHARKSNSRNALIIDTFFRR